MSKTNRIAIAALFLCSTLLLNAQQPTGAISGVVTDPKSGVLAGAEVAIGSKATGASRALTTNDTGFFLASNLQPGEYSVNIQFKGFAPYAAVVTVAVGQTVHLNATLQLSASQQQVVVTDDAIPAVDTQSATVQGVINARQIEELPLNGRNFLELARLQPGVEIQEGRAFDPTKTRYSGISIGGRTGREARITIDGVDVVDEHVGTTLINISQETIQEFQLSTSSADISTGLSATGGVNVITRRGNNDVHGNGFIYGRGSNYAARPSLAPTAPDFDRKQYGFSAGGPLIKDKLFWFGAFEKTDENSAIAIATPYFPSLTSYAAPFGERSGNARLDWHVLKSDMFLRWSGNDNSNFGGFGGNTLPSAGNFNSDSTHQFVVGADTPLTPRMTNGLRVATTIFQNRILRPDAASLAITVPGTTGFRVSTDDGLLVAGADRNTPQSTYEHFTQMRDDLTWSSGRHTVRFGFDATLRKVRVYNYVDGFPSFSVASPASRNPADILNTTIVSISIGNRKGIRIPGTPDDTHRNARLSGYVTDTWRLRPNFTINAGLRYEADTHPLNNDLNKPTFVAPLLPNGTAPTPNDRNNFAPSVAFAWDPWNNGKTSIRAGAGIYYAMQISNLVTNERASLAPFNSGQTQISLTQGTSGVQDFNKDGVTDFDFTPALKTGVTLAQAFPIVSAGQLVFANAPQASLSTLAILRSGTMIDNNLVTPYSQQFNVGVQRQLPMNGAIDVNFVYSRTNHEFMRDIDVANLFPGNGAKITLGDGLPPTGQIQMVTSDGFSQYKALTARYDKRFSQRYQLTASYALARLMTTTPDGLGLGSTPLVNRNIKANYGPGALDRTHRLTLNGVTELPWGFRASLISAWSSGLPASATVGSADLNGDGVAGSLLPGTSRGALGRDIRDAATLNALIKKYNLSTGGKNLPRGGQAPFLLEVPDTISFGDSFISQDLQVSKVIKIHERLRVELTGQVFNLFNISNLVGSAGLPGSAFNGSLTVVNAASGAPSGGFKLGTDGSLLNAAGTRALAGVDRASGFASLGAIRPVIPTGSGLPRAFQFGARVSF